MIHVRVAELKASLSAFLAKVRAGETVTVTDLWHPIAPLVPVRGADVDFSAQLANLERLSPVETIGQAWLSKFRLLHVGR